MSGDPERDGSKPRPAAPAGVLGGQGKRAESAPVETAAKVPKSVFAQTIVGLQVPGAAPAPVPEAPQAAEQAEPLRDPSDRPAPVPYKRAHGAWGGTMPMPDPSAPAGNQSRERMITAKSGAGSQESSVAVRPAAVIGTPEGREPTVRMPTTASSAAPDAPPPSSRPLPAPPPPSGAPPAMPPPSAAATSASPRPQAPSMRAQEAKRDEPSVPRLSLGVEKIPAQEPATKVEFTGQSQPLQLALDARDHVESSLRPESAVPQRSMMPWIALAVIAVLGGLAFAFMGGEDAPPPVAPERVEAVPAAEPTTPTTPTTEAAAQAAGPAVPVAPAAPVLAPKPAAPPPSAAKPTEPKEAAKPAAKRKPARSTKKRAAASSNDPVLKVTPQGDDLEAAARAAERFAEPEQDLEPPEPPAAEPPSPDEE